MNTINITCKAHLTENHQLKAADALISKLRIQLGEERSYTEELILEISKLKEEIEDLRNGICPNIQEVIEENAKLKLHYKQLSDRYSVLKGNMITEHPIFPKYKEALADNKKLRDTNEELICTIVKLRNERNN